jgi:glyoxylase-like metal-dependent hydrolase (beta-lactamase superfamily II)
LATCLLSAAFALTAPIFAADLPEACASYTAAVTGGPLPPADSETVVIRWLGNANYEFAYKGKVYLFDSYFDRTPRSHKLGFTAADVKTATAIFVSHAHFDHVSDIGPVSRQTGAPVVFDYIERFYNRASEHPAKSLLFNNIDRRYCHYIPHRYDA